MNEATAEMMLQDTHQDEVLFQFNKVNGRIIIINAEGTLEEFQQSPAKLTQSWNDQTQNACSQEIDAIRQELRMPLLHQRLFVPKLEKRNCQPEFRRCEVQKRNYKHCC